MVNQDNLIINYHSFLIIDNYCPSYSTLFFDVRNGEHFKYLHLFYTANLAKIFSAAASPVRTAPSKKPAQPSANSVPAQ